jgi:hypothetical protein
MRYNQLMSNYNSDNLRGIRFLSQLLTALLIQMISKSRRRFTHEEDEQLFKLVGQFGVNSWSIIAAGIPNRTVRQCRDRWRHYLSVPTHRSPWTAEEDARLSQKVDEVGLKWVELSKFFQNRSDLDVKRRWFQIYQKQHNLLKTTLSRPMMSRRRRISLEVSQETTEASDQTQNDGIQGIDSADLCEFTWMTDSEDTEDF